MRLIPAIDMIGGKCVRLTKGDYKQQTTYSDDPLEVAKAFESAGIQYLHLVDLDGAKAGKVINWDVVEHICSQTNLNVDFGGGLRTTEDAERAFELGVNQITGGSIAVKNQPLFLEWLDRFGPDKLILGMDVRNRKVAIHGWQEESERGMLDFLQFYVEKGVRFVVCTDIQKDGMLTGPAVELYSELLQHFPEIKLIASGGIAEEEDLDELKGLGMDGAIFGKAFYEGKITLDQLKNRAHAG